MPELNSIPLTDSESRDAQFTRRLYQLAAAIVVAFLLLIFFAPFDLTIVLGVPLIALMLIASIFGAVGWKNWGSVLVTWVFIAIVLPMLLLPSILPSRHKGEVRAIGHLRTINTAEVTYLSSSGGNYGAIRDLIKAGLLDSTFSEVKDGYRFHVVASGADYTATAQPVAFAKSRYGYYSTPDAVVRYAFEHNETCNPCFPKGLAGQAVQ